MNFIESFENMTFLCRRKSKNLFVNKNGFLFLYDRNGSGIFFKYKRFKKYSSKCSRRNFGKPSKKKQRLQFIGVGLDDFECRFSNELLSSFLTKENKLARTIK